MYYSPQIGQFRAACIAHWPKTILYQTIMNMPFNSNRKALITHHSSLQRRSTQKKYNQSSNINTSSDSSRLYWLRCHVMSCVVAFFFQFFSSFCGRVCLYCINIYLSFVIHCKQTITHTHTHHSIPFRINLILFLTCLDEFISVSTSFPFSQRSQLRINPARRRLYLHSVIIKCFSHFILT